MKLLRIAGFLWDASRGYRLRPWASPYIRWRIETYSGMPAAEVDREKFWAFVGREKPRLLTFLRWAGEMRVSGGS